MTRYSLIDATGRLMCGHTFEFYSLAVLWAIEHNLRGWFVRAVSAA